MLLPRYYLTNLPNLPDGIGISPAMCYDWGPTYHVEKLLSFPLVPLSFSGKSGFLSYALIFVGASGPLLAHKAIRLEYKIWTMK